MVFVSYLKHFCGWRANIRRLQNLRKIDRLQLALDNRGSCKVDLDCLKLFEIWIVLVVNRNVSLALRGVVRPLRLTHLFLRTED